MAFEKLLLTVATIASCTQNLYASGQTTVPVKVVDLGYATYQTDVSLDEGVTSFLGIRFAAPPIGKSSALRILWKM
jgi:hypothetical protein